jgi:hypothetical protein
MIWLKILEKARAQSMAIRLLAVLVMLGAAAPAAVFNFYSGFNTPGATEGWTIKTYGYSAPGGVGPLQVASGGLSGGYLQTEDSMGGFLFLMAPGSWSGNLNGGVLSFYLRNQNPANYFYTTTDPQPVLWVTDGTSDLFALWGGGLPGLTGTGWSYNQAVLNSSLPNWSLSPYGPVAPAPAFVTSVLSNVTQIGILADWVTRYAGHPSGCNSITGDCTDITGLDEVRLYGGQIPEPGTMGLLAAGLAALAVWRRRAR